MHGKAPRHLPKNDGRNGSAVKHLQQDRMTGLASAVQSADKASHVLIWTEDCVALVALGQAGVELTERPTWDKTRHLFDVKFVEVELDQDLLLASGAPGGKLARRLSTLRDVALAADAVGGAAGLLALTVEHLETRQQFGRPLAL